MENYTNHLKRKGYSKKQIEIYQIINDNRIFNTLLRNNIIEYIDSYNKNDIYILYKFIAKRSGLKCYKDMEYETPKYYEDSWNTIGKKMAQKLLSKWHDIEKVLLK